MTSMPICAADLLNEDDAGTYHSHSSASDRLDMVMNTGKMWQPGDTLTIKMTECDRDTARKVERYARVWLEYANLKMKFVSSGKSDIRISFDTRKGNWSAVGTDCKKSKYKDRPTMNFDCFDGKKSEDTVRQVVLHEFGHALGCEHEHQSPQATIRWNKEVIYKEMDRFGWGRTRVDTNFFDRISRYRTQSTTFDKKSIMLYAIPERWTKDGFHTRPNKELSEKDKGFIAKLYPISKSRHHDRNYKSDSDSDSESEFEESKSRPTPRKRNSRNGGKSDGYSDEDSGLSETSIRDRS